MDQAKSALRGFSMPRRRTILIQDEVTGAKGTVRWAMMTRAEISAKGSQAALSLGGKKMLAKILSPAGAEFETAPAKPPTDRERKNEGYRMLVINAKPQAASTLTIGVVLCPDGVASPVKAGDLKPLSSWPGKR